MAHEVRYEKSLRKLAAQAGDSLITIDIDGRTGKRSRVTYQTRVPKELAARVYAFMLEMFKASNDANKPRVKKKRAAK